MPDPQTLMTWLLIATGFTGGLTLVHVIRWVRNWLFAPLELVQENDDVVTAIRTIGDAIWGERSEPRQHLQRDPAHARSPPSEKRVMCSARTSIRGRRPSMRSTTGAQCL